MTESHDTNSTEFIKGYEAALRADWSNAEWRTAKDPRDKFNRWVKIMLDKETREFGSWSGWRGVEFESGWVAGARVRFDEFMESDK